MQLSPYFWIRKGLDKHVPATGLGLFRMAFALVILHEVGFLYYFRQLIFDPVPYLDIASPSVHFFLVFWFVAAVCLLLGYRTRLAAIANYLFWLLFTIFTPMWKDFDGGFDQLMLGSSFLLIFLPTERAWALDRLRYSLARSRPGHIVTETRTVSVLAYLLPLGLSLGLVYVDSFLHKLFAEFWRQGLGPWLPASLPYYQSPLDLSAWLNIEWLQRLSGYTILIFQCVYLPLFCFRRFRVPLLLVGSSLHIGIILALNIYPFGFGMLVHYLLLVPFAWWRACGRLMQHPRPVLRVFYDEHCPLCLRAVITLRHFDILQGVAFLGLQSHAAEHVELADLPASVLLGDLYSLDQQGRRYAGVDTYSRILLAMRYPAVFGILMQMPGLHQLAVRYYRHIADNRQRLDCNATVCAPAPPPVAPTLAEMLALWGGATERLQVRRITRLVIVVLVLQLNCMLHYGVFYRLGALKEPVNEGAQVLVAVSNGLISLSHSFLGITPHPLYLHDHFEGYNHILAITWRQADGQEVWLPFIAEDGHMLAPNWGRVHSMWANVAVTRHMDARRLDKFIRKLTAYYGTQMGIDLNDAQFVIKLKTVQAPMHWVRDLRAMNAASPWQDVGVAVWFQQRMYLQLDEDLEWLSRD